MAIARKTTALILPDELAARMVAAKVRMDTQRDVLNAVTGAGVDVSDPEATRYLDAATASITEAALEYSKCQLEVVALARKEGNYDPAKCTPIQAKHLEDTGAVTWTILQADEETV